jgi:tripartite-type tricarboxylate transporter receptor subunit TctC
MKALRRFAAATCAMVSCGAGCNATAAEPGSYPTKSIRLVVPFAPGGGTDFVSRLVGQKLGESLQQSVVIDNRAGASGSIGADMVAKAVPDGYTIVAITAEHTVFPAVQKKMPYDLARDFVPITQTTAQSYVLVVQPSLAATNVKELVALIKAGGGQVNFGTSQWSVGHLAGELFKLRTGVDMTHIPFKGTGPALIGLFSGQISLMFSTAPPVAPHIKSGKLRALGITATKRSPLMPDLPTIAEAGVAGFEALGWNGFLAPARTPQVIVARLNREVARILALPDVRERYATAGIEPVGGSSEAFGTLIRAELVKWAQVVRDAKLRTDE